MSFKTIELEINDGVAKITFAQSSKLNSLNEQAHQEIRSALDQIENDKTARVLVITGKGRAFCAGQDLNSPEMRPSKGKAPDIGEVVERNYKTLVLRLQNSAIPTVAAVNGLAAGGGMSIALACDIVIAKESAYFLQAFSKIGLSPDTGSTWFLPQRIGMARAMALAFLAEKLSAKDAQDWGLIWECVDDSQFDEHIDKLAERLATMPTKALVRTRQAMHAAGNHTLEQQLSQEAGFIRELGWRDDYLEGVQAFEEKRPPQFTGN